MRNWALVVGAVIAVLVVLAVAVPALIDWSRYKGDIVARVEAATGREVAISGPIGLGLLPSPAVTADGVSIANPPGAQGNLATVERLRLRVAVLPLLTGRVHINSLELDNPVIALARLPDGRANWSFEDAAPGGDATAPQPPHRATKAEPPAAPAAQADEKLPVGRVTIHGGTVTYAGRSGAPLVLDRIDADVSLGGRSGPFMAKGDARLAGMPLEFDAAVDRLAAGRGSPATVTLKLPGDDARAEFSGLVTRLSGGETLRGRLTISAAHLDRTLARLGIAAPLPPGAPLAAEADLSLATDEIAATNLTASLGETRATGAVTAALGQVPQVDVQLGVSGLDLDKWQAPTPAASDAPAKAPPAQSRTAEAPAAAPATQPAPGGGFALPKQLFLSANLSIEALSWHGQVVREARLEAVLDQGEAAIRKLSAQLPGGSTLTGDGMLAAEAGRPVFDGQVRLHSDNLRSLLALAGAEPAGVPENRLRALDFSSPVRLAWPEIHLSGFTLNLDASRARGTASARLDGRPSFGLDASVDSVNVDAYRPATPQTTGQAAPVQPDQPATKAEPQAGKASAPPSDTGLAGFDADVKLAVQKLVLNEVTADSVTLDGLWQGGQLTLRQLSGEVAGGRAKLQGRVLGMAEDAPRLEKVTIQLNSPQPARLYRLLGGKPPAILDRLAPLDAAGTLSGDLAQMAVDARAEAAGLEVTARGSVAPQRTDLALQARHASTAQVIRLLEPTYRPQGTIGAFALDAKVAGDVNALSLTGVSLTAGQARLDGQGRVDLAGKPRVTADLSGNALALDPFLAAERTGMLLPGGPHVPPTLAPGRVSILPAAAPPPGAVGAGPSPFSNEPLDLSALQSFDALVNLKAESVVAKGWRLDQPVAQVAVQNGGASVERLTGKLLGGDMALSAKLSSGAVPALAGQLTVTGADLGAAKLAMGPVNVTQGRMDAETRFTTSGRSSQDMAAKLNGEGKLLVRDGVLEGFDLPAVNQRLNNIENVGSLLGVAQAGLSGGKTPFSQLSGTFRAENGVVTSRDLKMDAQGGGATAETTVDLARWTTSTIIAMRLENAAQTPLLVRLEGPLDNPRKIIDVNALQQYLVSRGLGRALKNKDVGSILQGVLGNKSTTQPPAEQAPAQPAQPGEPQQTEQPREKNTGKAILKDLLKGLGGGGR